MITAALVVAAGRGTRMGRTTPKQYLPVHGRPLLGWTLSHLQQCPQIQHILPVIHPDDADLFATAHTGHDKIHPPVLGGEERQVSVRHGLDALREINPDIVLIHDAARPLVKAQIIVRLLDALASGARGALPGLPMVDTIKKTSSQDTILETIPRTNLWRAQTPQAFYYKDILNAHIAHATESHTDDAALMEREGHTVQMIPGTESLMKVTEPADMLRMESLLHTQTPDIRTGFGFDVHAFEPGNAVVLCGVAIPHSHKLKGHSDADVAMHALTDALLGAIAAGDIGIHFPPSDPHWRGAPSHIFLDHARKLVTQHGGIISHIDLTIMCEAPKVGPYRDVMRQNLAKILQIEDTRVSVKATTTEKLGFTGRREGIAAQACATVRLPLASCP